MATATLNYTYHVVQVSQRRYQIGRSVEGNHQVRIEGQMVSLSQIELIGDKLSLTDALAEYKKLTGKTCDTNPIAMIAPYMDPVKASEAIERRNEADYQCYMQLREVIKEAYAVLRKHYIADLGEEEGLERLAEIEQVVRDRDVANNDFLEAMIANRPDRKAS